MREKARKKYKINRIARELLIPFGNAGRSIICPGTCDCRRSSQSAVT